MKKIKWQIVREAQVDEEDEVTLRVRLAFRGGPHPVMEISKEGHSWEEVMGFHLTRGKHCITRKAKPSHASWIHDHFWTNRLNQVSTYQETVDQ